jgi:dethiobiotin synthetase
MSSLLRGLFVTGTDTNVGKTHVAGTIIRCLRQAGHRVGAYKPACSGAITDATGRVQWDDIERLRSALEVDCPDDLICPQRFLAPLAPPMAAQAEGRHVDFDLLVKGAELWHRRADVLIVEGAGGLLAPVAESKTVADLAMSVGYPLVIVARCGLGTINHTLLTVEAARHRGLLVAGIVLNQSPLEDDVALAESNAVVIESYGQVPVLGIIAWGTSDGLHRHGRVVTIPWSDLARN